MASTSTGLSVLNLSDYMSCIGNSSHHEVIIDVLEVAGIHEMSDRLKYLHRIIQDPNPLEPPMKLSSLKNLAVFFVENPDQLSGPRLRLIPMDCYMFSGILAVLLL